MPKQKILNDIAKGVKEHAPLILSICAGVGVIVTAILSEKAGERAEQLRQDADILEEKEIFKESVKAAVPAISTAVITIFCIASAQYLNQKTQATLAAMYVGAVESYRQYRKTNIDINGEEADEKVMTEIKKTEPENGPLPADGDILVWTEDTGFFNVSVANLINAEMHTDRVLLHDMSVSLVDFYYFLGLDVRKILAEHPGLENYGWTLEYLEDCYKSYWLDFYHYKNTTDDGLEYYEIIYSLDPIDIYEYNENCV